MPHQNIYSDSATKVDLYKSSDENTKIAFIFSPSMNRDLDGNRFGGNLLLANGFDVMSIKINDDSWFQNVPSVIIDNLKKISIDNNYAYRIGYGSSMGGFASIALSNFLNLDCVVALSPQFSISESFDTRWEPWAKKINNWKYVITEETINKTCFYYLLYDNKDLDNTHIHKITSLIDKNNYLKIEYPYCGHPITHFLNDANILKETIIDLVNGVFVKQNQSVLKKYKIKSTSYFQNIALKLLSRNKPNWALTAINCAIELNPNIAGFFRHKSIILNKLNLTDEAIAAAKRATELDPSNFILVSHLSHLLTHAKKFDEALHYSDKYISINTNDAFGHLHHSNVLFQLNQAQEALIWIDRAIELNPNIAGFFRHKSIILNKLNLTDEAIAAAKRATELDQIA